MSKEEFLNSIRRFEELEKKYEALYKKFSAFIRTELTNIVFEHLDDFAARKDDLYEKVMKISEKYISELWETYNIAVSYQMGDEDVPTAGTFRTESKTKEEAKEDLKEELKNIPQDKDLYREIFWESYESEYKNKLYIHTIYEKMKEGLAECYLEDILSFDGPVLRYFDQGIKHCAFWFADEVYSLVETKKVD